MRLHRFHISKQPTGSVLPSIAFRGGGPGEDDDGSYVLMIKSPAVVPSLTLGGFESLSSWRPSNKAEDSRPQPPSLQRNSASNRLTLVEFSKRYARHLFRSHPAVAQLTAVHAQ
jgi:hypothetical protein